MSFSSSRSQTNGGILVDEEDAVFIILEGTAGLSASHPTDIQLVERIKNNYSDRPIVVLSVDWVYDSTQDGCRQEVEGYKINTSIQGLRNEENEDGTIKADDDNRDSKTNKSNKREREVEHEDQFNIMASGGDEGSTNLGRDDGDRRRMASHPKRRRGHL